MKRQIALLLSFAIIFLLCSCSNNSLTYNGDFSEVYYNGYTYLDLNNNNGKYHVNKEECVEVARIPYGILYIFGAVTSYYGNDQEKPDFLASSRSEGLYLREDLSIDHSSVLTVQHDGEPFSFTIAENTTGEVVEYSKNDPQNFGKLLDFMVTVEEFPAISMHIYIVKKDGVMYLQDCYNSNYYVIKEEFLDTLNQAFGVQKSERTGTGYVSSD